MLSNVRIVFCLMAVAAAALWACGGDLPQACPGGEVCEWPLASDSSAALNGETLSTEWTVGSIEFPSGSEQRDGRWYRLDLELDLQVRTPVGVDDLGAALPAYLSMAVDSGTAFQLKLTQGSPGSEDCWFLGNSGVEWSTYGLVNGTQSGPVPCDGFLRVRFANYLQTRAVHPGRVPVTLQFAGANPKLLESLYVGPGSKITVSREGPPQLEIVPEAASAEVVQGATEAQLRVRVELDGEPSNNASVTVHHVTPAGEAISSTEAVRKGTGYEALIAWDGTSDASLLVSAALDEGSALLFVTVGHSRGRGHPTPVEISAVVGGGLLAAGLIGPFLPGWLGRIRRRRGSRCQKSTTPADSAR